MTLQPHIQWLDVGMSSNRDLAGQEGFFFQFDNDVEIIKGLDAAFNKKFRLDLRIKGYIFLLIFKTSRCTKLQLNENLDQTLEYLQTLNNSFCVWRYYYRCTQVKQSNFKMFGGNPVEWFC